MKPTEKKPEVKPEVPVKPTEKKPEVKPDIPVKSVDKKPVDVTNTEAMTTSVTEKSLPETGDVSLLGMGLVSLYGAVKLKRKNRKK